MSGEVTDPELLAKLNAKEVTDPRILSLLNEGKTPVPPQQPGLLEQAVVGPLKGLYRGLIQGPISLVQAAAQTPSDIAYMAKNPSAIPGILGQTAINTVRMAPAAIGYGVGGPMGGASVAALQQDLEARMRGEQPNLESTLANITEAAAPAKAMNMIPGIAPRAGKVTPEGTRLSETAKQAGFQPSVTDVAPGQVLGRAEAFAERQFGGGRLTQRAQQEVKTMRGTEITGEPGWLVQEGERIAPTSGVSSVARGETIRDGLKQIADQNRGLSRDYVWEEVKGFDNGRAILPVNAIADAAADMLRKPEVLESIRKPATGAQLRSTGGIETSEGAFSTQKMVQGADVNESLLKSLANHRDVPLTFEQMRVLREEIGRRYNDNPARWGKLFGAIKDDMRTGLQKIPGASEAYERALTYEKANVLPFKSTEPEGMLGRLIDQQEPAKVMDYLLSQKDRSISGLRAIQAQTGGAGPIWESIQGEGIARILADPRQLKQIGPETKRLLFTPEQLEFMDTYSNYLRTSSSAGKTLKAFERPTGVLTAIASQVGHAATLILSLGGGAAAAQYGHPGLGLAGATVVALSPNIIARMLTNPTTAKWLTVGLRAPAGTAEAMRAAQVILPAYIQATGEERKQTQLPKMPSMPFTPKEAPTWNLRGVNSQ